MTSVKHIRIEMFSYVDLEIINLDNFSFKNIFVEEDIFENPL